ncbi:acyl-CoA carboxylase epsilon subunit [Streptomyces sp. NPDC048232]|uniref:acyl-CoA carboxylase epsilon subunit n=1 Tax=Streptomyces TaxID=1883 RepID=UPI000F01C841|nr:acyl-CoA carboxylase epsilon subunit [Streptomyces sp. Tu 4128]
MEGVRGKDAWLRIERGCATEEELAAVTLLLLAAVRGAVRTQGAGSRPPAPWGRRERAGAYREPRGWR